MCDFTNPKGMVANMIYLLEDDGGVRELIIYTLNSYGMTARGFERPVEFRKAMSERLPSLVILDIMLPEEDGLLVLREIRGNPRTSRLPVMILSAKCIEYDRVTGLDAGADDYVCKPFGMMELVSRVRALLRRAGSGVADTVFENCNLEVFPDKHLVISDGREVNLTLKEFDLLCLLLQNPGMVFTRDQILNHVWGYSFDGESRTVDVHVRTLRKKLGASGRLIETVRGIGYRIRGGEIK
ncbi:MAG: response regulator transcription factor [Eubacteriales bacterium]|jgi:two-component system alkaline phosphatase synthesis response regulator PhoP